MTVSQAFAFLKLQTVTTSTPRLFIVNTKQFKIFTVFCLVGFPGFLIRISQSLFYLILMTYDPQTQTAQKCLFHWYILLTHPKSKWTFDVWLLQVVFLVVLTSIKDILLKVGACHHVHQIPWDSNIGWMRKTRWSKWWNSWTLLATSAGIFYMHSPQKFHAEICKRWWITGEQHVFWYLKWRNPESLILSYFCGAGFSLTYICLGSLNDLFFWGGDQTWCKCRVILREKLLGTWNPRDPITSWEW